MGRLQTDFLRKILTRKGQIPRPREWHVGCYCQEVKELDAMKTTLNYLKTRVIPPLTFGLFVAVEGAVVYELYKVLVR